MQLIVYERDNKQFNVFHAGLIQVLQNFLVNNNKKITLYLV